jgi:FixJ family two-component response regulator
LNTTADQIEKRTKSTSSISASTVYIVDDDPDARQWISSTMGSVNLSAATFDSAESFLAAYDPRRPGCLLLEMRMPGMSGLELLRILTSRTEDSLPVIMLTAFADVPTAVEAMQMGAHDFLEKPHPPQSLIEKVKQAIQLDQQRCQRDLVDLETEKLLRTLTPRENEIMKLMMAGSTAKKVARHLQISVRTVDFHRRHLLEKMHVDNMVQLTRLLDEFHFHRSRKESYRREPI